MAQPQARLLGRYGTESAAVAGAGRRPPRARSNRSVAGLPYTGAELVYAVARGDGPHARRRAVARRTRATIQRAQATMDAAGAIAAALIAPDMGWDDQEAADQASALHRLLPEGAPDRGARPAVTAPTPGHAHRRGGRRHR